MAKIHKLIFASLNCCFLSLTFTLLCNAQNVLSQKTESLRWGADARGGAPYVFPDIGNPSKIKGFEVDILEEISRIMHRKTQFVQNSYEGLISGLSRSQYDLVIQGIVITNEHSEEVDFTIPYYSTYQTIVVKSNNNTIASLADCKGKKIGTLTGSEAYNFLLKTPGIEILAYEHEVVGYQDIASDRIDGFVIDAPVAMYYVPTTPGLKIVNVQLDTLLYGIAVKKGNTLLRDELSAALRIMQNNGKLRAILERWNLWNGQMADLLQDYSPTIAQPVEYESFINSANRQISWSQRLERYVSFIPFFIKAASTTLRISLLAMLLAMAVGLLLSLMRVYSILGFLAVGYIEIIRGTPLIIQLFFIYYGLPNIGIKLDPFVAAVLGLGLNYAAFEAENYRAGLLAVPRGQTEAATALGMTSWQSLRFVVLPQAMRIVIPPITNDFISLIKDSSLVSMIAIMELTQQYNLLATTYYDYFGIGIQVAIVYLLIGLPFVFLSRWMEKRISIDIRSGSQSPKMIKWGRMS